MQGRRLSAVAVILLFPSLLLSGCATTRSWSYRPDPRRLAAPVSKLSLAVLPFQDRRENVNRDRLGLYVIPLFPYGWADYETPEGVDRHVTSGLWQFRPPEDFARAVAQEIENARIFREAFLTNRASEGDLVLTGEIRSTLYQGKILSYGLSLAGPFLWFFGLPAVTTSNELEIRLTLSKTPSSPALWSYTIHDEAHDMSWVYVMRPDFQYDTLLKQGIEKALPSLREEAARLAAHSATDPGSSKPAGR